MKKFIQICISTSSCYLLILFLTGFICSITSFAQNSVWQSNGPNGGYINCLTLSKSNPDILYAGTNHGLYKTENGGENWFKTNFSDFYIVTSIKVHSTNPNIIIAGTKSKGVYRSGNGGESWQYNGLWDYTISTMAIDNNDPDVLYFGTGEELTGTDIGIYKVDDDWQSGGPIKHWKSTGECGWNMVSKIIVDPDSSKWIYAAGLTSSYCSNYGGLLFSQDGGSTWEDKETGYDDKLTNIAITKNNTGEKTIYVFDGGTYTTIKELKLFKSEDNGDSWLEVTNPYSGNFNPNILLTNPGNSNEVIIGSSSSSKPLWIYNNETDTWSYINGNGLPGTIAATCLETSSDGNTFYMPTLRGGIYKFNSNENTWNKINIGFDNSLVNDLIVIPNSCNTVYSSTDVEEFLNKTTDGGSTWGINQSNLGASFDVLTIDPNNPSVFYAAKSSLSYYRLVKSENYGQSWSGAINFVECVGNACYTEITDILVKPGDSNSILVSTQPYFLSSGLTGFGVIARTTDGGKNWDKLFQSSGIAMAVDPQNPDIVYIGKERSGQVFKVQDTWGNQNISEITPEAGIENVQDIAVDEQSNIYVATEDGFWKWDGNTWKMLNCLANNITALAIDNSKNPSVVYAGSEEDGIYVSNDAGETWIPFNEGFNFAKINNLEICENTIYAGTEYAGLWSREIPNTITPPFLTHNTGNMEISVFQNGAIGHAAPNWSYGKGLVYKNNIDPLFYCGLILGTAERGYVNGQIGSLGINSDFQNTSSISEVNPVNESWDQITTSQFNDYSSLMPYGFDINQRSYSNDGEDILMLKYTIKNTAESKNNLYAGLFADWDVGGGDFHDSNLGGFDLSRNLTYQFLKSGNPDQNYYGIVALNGMSGTRVTGKGHHLHIRDSSFVWISTLNDKEITEAGEYRSWIGSGPFNLDKDNSLQVYFAIVAGSTLEDIKSNADLAASRHQDLLTSIESKKTLLGNFHLEQNYPNPFSRNTQIDYTIAEECDVLLELFNSQGVKIKSLVNKKQVSGNYSELLNIDNLDPGFYFYRLKAGEFIDTKKMICTE